MADADRSAPINGFMKLGTNLIHTPAQAPVAGLVVIAGILLRGVLGHEDHPGFLLSFAADGCMQIQANARNPGVKMLLKNAASIIKNE
ncbi:MAG: hypothetical protein JNL16_07515 [Dechloromonas sp.]|nr:hypothetical protein [Dechloromonas sp.]